MDDKKVVELWTLNCFMGVIVPMETGVVFTNQAGGMGCYHPKAEGLFIPLNAVTEHPEDPLIDHWSGWVQDVSTGLIQQFLENFFLEGMFSAPKEMPAGEWGEAWVPVVVENSHHHYIELLKSFIGKTVIITYPNSD